MGAPEHGSTRVLEVDATRQPDHTLVPDAAPPFALGPASEPDRYLVERSIDVGAEGIVYRASTASPSGVRTVAVKSMFGSPRQDVAERFAHRALLCRIHHPGLVRLRESFVGPPVHAVQGTPPDGQVTYLVMDWIEGQTLEEAVAASGLMTRTSLAALAPIADALDTLHDGRQSGGIGLVHRDVKPANIVLRCTGGAVLVDCSGACPAGSNHPGMGTPCYRAPEASGGTYTPASDLYGFAGSLLFCLTGVHPCGGESADADLHCLEGTDLRPHQVDLLRAARAADPAERPRGAKRLLAAIMSD